MSLKILSFVFFNIRNWLTLVNCKNNKRYNIRSIQDTLENDFNRIDFLYANMEEEALSSIIFERIDEEEISGLINGNIPFTLNIVDKEPLFTTIDFTNHTFISDFDEEDNVIYALKLNTGKRTISVGKDNFSFQNDSVTILKRHKVDYFSDNIATDEEGFLEKTLFIHHMRWYLDNTGQNIYVCYYYPSLGVEPISGNNLYGRKIQDFKKR